MTTFWTLGCDAHDPHLLATFWRDALGYETEAGYDDPDGASIVDPEGVLPAIGWLRVPEGKTAKNRVHLDLVSGDAGRDAEVARLVDLGATKVDDHDEYGHQWTVMHDPEGNEFCVA